MVASARPAPPAQSSTPRARRTASTSHTLSAAAPSAPVVTRCSTIRARAHAFVALQTPDPAARRAAEARALYWRRVAAQRDPTDPEGWFLLADDERAAGMLEQAAAHYQRALVHDPFHVAAMRRLADMAVNAGDRLAALQWLERIQAVVPSPALTEEIGELRSYQPSA